MVNIFSSQNWINKTQKSSQKSHKIRLATTLTEDLSQETLPISTGGRVYIRGKDGVLRYLDKTDADGLRTQDIEKVLNFVGNRRVVANLYEARRVAKENLKQTA